MQTGFKDCSLAGFISRSSAVWSRLKRRRNRIYLISPTIKIFQSWPPTPVATRSRIFHSAHDTMLCIAQSSYVDSDDRVKSSPDAWMKQGDEMRRLFEDLPEALANRSEEH